MAAFAESEFLRSRLLRSYEVMLGFLGLCRGTGDDGRREIGPGRGFLARSAVWTSPYNHNQLRISRILRCLGLLGLKAEAEALYEFLVSMVGSGDTGISATTMDYWMRSIADPLAG